MTRVDILHNNLGCHVFVNGKDIGVFDNEHDAFKYIILNNLIDTLIIDRGYE